MFNLLKSTIEMLDKKSPYLFNLGIHISKINDVLIVEGTDNHVALRAVLKNEKWIEKIENDTDLVIDAIFLSKILKGFKKNQDVPVEIKNKVVTINGTEIPTLCVKYPDLERALRFCQKSNDNSTALISFHSLQKISKAGILALSGYPTDSFLMTASDGASFIKYEASTVDYDLIFMQAPYKK